MAARAAGTWVLQGRSPAWTMRFAPAPSSSAHSVGADEFARQWLADRPDTLEIVGHDCNDQVARIQAHGAAHLALRRAAVLDQDIVAG